MGVVHKNTPSSSYYGYTVIHDLYTVRDTCINK